MFSKKDVRVFRKTSTCFFIPFRTGKVMLRPRISIRLIRKPIAVKKKIQKRILYLKKICIFVDEKKRSFTTGSPCCNKEG